MGWLGRLGLRLGLGQLGLEQLASLRLVGLVVIAHPTNRQSLPPSLMGGQYAGFNPAHR